MSGEIPRLAGSKTPTSDRDEPLGPSSATDGFGRRDRFNLADDRMVIAYAAREWNITCSGVEETLKMPHERARKSLARLVKMEQLDIHISQTEGIETSYSYIVDLSHFSKPKKGSFVIDCVTKKNRDRRLEGLKLPTQEDLTLFEAMCNGRAESALYTKLNDSPPILKGGRKHYFPPGVFDATKALLLKQGKITESYNGTIGESEFKKV